MRQVTPSTAPISKESPGKALLGREGGGETSTYIQVNDTYGYDAVVKAIEKGADDGLVPLNRFELVEFKKPGARRLRRDSFAIPFGICSSVTYSSLPQAAVGVHPVQPPGAAPAGRRLRCRDPRQQDAVPPGGQAGPTA